MASSSWILLLALPFMRQPDEGAMTVIFYPWVGQAEQMEALTSADLYLGGRPGRFALTGFAPRDWSQADDLRRHGAFLIIASDDFAVCQPEEVLAAAALTETDHV
jgi:hypothetical protein